MDGYEPVGGDDANWTDPCNCCVLGWIPLVHTSIPCGRRVPVIVQYYSQPTTGLWLLPTGLSAPSPIMPLKLGFIIH